MPKYLAGAGMTSCSPADTPLHEMCISAMQEALDFSSLSLSDIDAIFLSKENFSFEGDRQSLLSGILASITKKNIPIIQISAACASGGAAIWNAVRSPERTVLVLGMEKFGSATTPQITGEFLSASERLFEQQHGLIFPAQYALVAQQFMKKNGVDSDHLALVAHKNHENASLNPKARFFQKPLLLETIKKSPIVCSPLRLHDCSITVDGAAAAIITSKQTDIEIAGSALATTGLCAFERKDMTKFDATIAAAKNAYLQAGITPDKVDIAEVHDAFTPAEIMAYEDLGFARIGEGKIFLEKGYTKLSGKLPINTSGGLKARGHPISATGIMQLYELAQQMRTTAGKRQVAHAHVALAHNVGGCGSTAALHILRKVNP